MLLLLLLLEPLVLQLHHFEAFEWLEVVVVGVVVGRHPRQSLVQMALLLLRPEIVRVSRAGTGRRTADADLVVVVSGDVRPVVVVLVRGDVVAALVVGLGTGRRRAVLGHAEETADDHPAEVRGRHHVQVHQTHGGTLTFRRRTHFFLSALIYTVLSIRTRDVRAHVSRWLDEYGTSCLRSLGRGLTESREPRRARPGGAARAAFEVGGGATATPPLASAIGASRHARRPPLR